jgi:predicted ATP-grasp superfamily ATP-dependent carboligase
VELLGVTEQLVGEPWLNAKPFAYCGSVGPVPLPDADRTELDRLGTAIAEWGELRGLFGVDLVKHDGHYHVIEVNPRYTASIEVLESATGRFFVRHHAAAFESDSNQVTPAQPPATVVGKAILFASRRMTFPVEGPWDEDIRRDVHEFRHYADVPTPGSVIEPGWPILTILVQGHSPTEVRRLLYEKALVTQRLLESVR